MKVLQFLMQHQTEICLGLGWAISELLALNPNTKWNGVLQGLRDALKARAAAKAAS